jgi:hypothetical protein
VSSKGVASMATNCTSTQADATSTDRPPWQSWGTTVRYMMIRLSHALPTVALAYLEYAHHVSLLREAILLYPVLPTGAGLCRTRSQSGVAHSAIACDAEDAGRSALDGDLDPATGCSAREDGPDALMGPDTEVRNGEDHLATSAG